MKLRFGVLALLTLVAVSGSALADYQMIAVVNVDRVGYAIPPSCIGDLDCDGRMEIVGARYGYPSCVEIYELSTGNLEFSYNITQGGDMVGMSVQDIDGDSTPEVLIPLAYQTKILVIKFLGAPVAAPSSEVTTSAMSFPARPNPAQDSVKVDFSLTSPGTIEMIIVDVAGRVVRTIAQQETTAGRHSLIWDGTDREGRQVGSGAYFYEAKVDGRTIASNKIVLAR